MEGENKTMVIDTVESTRYLRVRMKGNQRLRPHLETTTLKGIRMARILLEMGGDGFARRRLDQHLIESVVM